ncbi:hypothetical protein MGMO_111c00260 [Methyloglobulus morosus KoM1]|uniref:Uncharacterized protein n=1 Tax=Methyloglobulus morosus KoM1 TaxID=1116472 RepID=V5DV74_9GAMM|nr:hypothetical protein MGMO_111c00260 [Methyloglobulus morosus KoM1]
MSIPEKGCVLENFRFYDETGSTKVISDPNRFYDAKLI